jgi:hypothetical protein
LHWGVRFARAALLCAVAVAAGVLLVSGGSGSDPRTPPALPGLPPPFLGTTVSGDGGLTAAVDAYGDVVDLRPGPAGAALIDNPSDRQAAGTVAEDTGIVPRLDGKAMWEADGVTQRYLPGTNVVRTVVRFGARRVTITVAATGGALAVSLASSSPAAHLSLGVDTQGVDCARETRPGRLDLVCGTGRAARSIQSGIDEDGATPATEGPRGHAETEEGDAGPATESRRAPVASRAAGLTAIAASEARRWLARSRPLGTDAPAWADAMYERSLLTIHALTSRQTGAVAAGARDGWAYVWPRDAATAALALAASGHHAEARHVAKFLTRLDLDTAARFTESGAPVPGRAAQGDALGWVTVAAKATGLPAPQGPYPWQDRADYQESSPGNYLGNALAAAATDVDGPITRHIGKFSAHQHGGLVRVEGDPGSGLDSAAGWAVRPFELTPLYPSAERTLLQLARNGTKYGITPSENWTGGNDPWTAPTAWSAWALAALARRPDVRDPRTNLPAVREGGGPSRRAALALLTDLRRASTPTGALPERVNVHTGVPTSTTPLLWSSAFAVLALRELWP